MFCYFEVLRTGQNAAVKREQDRILVRLVFAFLIGGLLGAACFVRLRPPSLYILRGATTAGALLTRFALLSLFSVSAFFFGTFLKLRGTFVIMPFLNGFCFGYLNVFFLYSSDFSGFPYVIVFLPQFFLLPGFFLLSEAGASRIIALRLSERTGVRRAFSFVDRIRLFLCLILLITGSFLYILLDPLIF